MKRLRLWLQVKFLTALTVSPVLLRWFATRHSTMKGLPGLEHAFLGLDHAGTLAELEGSVDEGKPYRVAVPVYLVMVPITLTTGGSTLWPLSPFYATVEAAQRFHAQLARQYPRCAVQCTLIALDPDDPFQRGAIENHKRQLVAEQLQNAR